MKRLRLPLNKIEPLKNSPAIQVISCNLSQKLFILSFSCDMYSGLSFCLVYYINFLYKYNYMPTPTHERL